MKRSRLCLYACGSLLLAGLSCIFNEDERDTGSRPEDPADMAAVPVLAVSEAATPLRVELLSEEEGGGYRLEEGLTMALPSSALSADALQAWRMDETEASKRLDERGVDLALPSNLTLLVALRVRLGATGQEVDFGEEGLKLSLDAEAIPANAIPANAIPANGIPSNAIPSNALPSSALPSSALTKALPSSQVPAEEGGCRVLPPSERDDQQRSLGS